MRGSPVIRKDIGNDIGIIPAHAGLTLRLGSGRAIRGDHPRACGAHTASTTTRPIITGSSPRMRGSLHIITRFVVIVGIIPAHAGLTVFFMGGGGQKRDHPRACGAHLHLHDLHLLIEGSSPRMRGSLIPLSYRLDLTGIIPAHAGLTCHPRRRHLSTRDHPRACGAHCSRCTACTMNRGSSPRMRGSLICIVGMCRIIGIIPAHAGLTSIHRQKENAERDHPRACGAHHLNAERSGNQQGSSPRMRGSPRGAGEAAGAASIIPAHAGLTNMQEPPAGGFWDHPRACGAHWLAVLDAGPETGSSPRMRGSLSSSPSVFPVDGIIPAHAGLTIK